MTRTPPCCAEAGETCDQHRQAASLERHRGLRRRHRSASAVLGESGRARPARPEETP